MCRRKDEVKQIIPRIPNRDTRKPMKANLKPKPKLEMPGNRKLTGANPIFFTMNRVQFGAPNAWPDGWLFWLRFGFVFGKPKS